MILRSLGKTGEGGGLFHGSRRFNLRSVERKFSPILKSGPLLSPTLSSLTNPSIDSPLSISLSIRRSSLILSLLAESIFPSL